MVVIYGITPSGIWEGQYAGRVKKNLKFKIFSEKCLKNWVGKSSDFTNPFVCGPRRGESEKMSRSVCLSVTYVVSDTLSGEYEKYKTKNLY